MNFRLAAVLGLSALFACGAEEPPLRPLPPKFPITDPPHAIASLEMAEGFTVELEDFLFTISRAVEAGGFESWKNLLRSDFRGTPLEGLAQIQATPLQFSVNHAAWQPKDSTTVGREDFLATFSTLLKDWEKVGYSRWEVLRAEFEPGRPLWGRALLEWTLRGPGKNGSVHALVLRFDTQVVQDLGVWGIRALHCERLETWHRAKPFFEEVSDWAGVAYRGLSETQEGSFPQDLRRQPFNGASCGDVDGDGHWDLFVSGKERNSLYLGDGQGRFRECAEEFGLLLPANGAGSAFFDFDNDGDQDLVVVGEGWEARDGRRVGSALQLYRNDGNRFRDVAKDFKMDLLLYSQSVIVLDYDGDGWLDIFVTNYGKRNRGNNSWSASDNGDSCTLLRNEGGKGFSDVSMAAGIDDRAWSYAASAADFDRDGDQDIYVAHDYARNSFFVNQGDGTFKDQGLDFAAEDVGFGMGVNWADLNNDGRLDLYIANMSSPVADRIFNRLAPNAAGLETARKLGRGNSIMLQGEDGTFQHMGEAMGGVRGMWAWGCATQDFDLDGRVDVFCANGMFSRSGVGEIHSLFYRNVVTSEVDPNMAPRIGMATEPNDQSFRKARVSMGKAGRSWGGWEADRLWLQQAAHGFQDYSLVSGLDFATDGRVAIACDFDEDGDLDLFLNEYSDTSFNHQRLMRNNLRDQPHGFLKLRLRATSGQYQAVGAEVVVQSPAGPCSQVLALGSGFLSEQPTELLFGIGEQEQATVEVIWPGGVRESFGSLDAGGTWLLVEGEGSAKAVR